MWYYEHPEHPGFIEAVAAAPDDDLPRLVYADWLDEHQELRGAGWRARLIRDGCDNHDWTWTCDGDSSVGMGCSGVPQQNVSVICHTCDLLYEAGVYWRMLGGDGDDYTFRRGFLERVTIGQFHGDELGLVHLPQAMQTDPLPAGGVDVRYKQPAETVSDQLVWFGMASSLFTDVLRPYEWFEGMTEQYNRAPGASPLRRVLTWENLLSQKVIGRIILTMSKTEQSVRAGWFHAADPRSGALMRHDLLAYASNAPAFRGQAALDLSEAMVGLSRDVLRTGKYTTRRDEPVTVGGRHHSRNSVPPGDDNVSPLSQTPTG